MTVNSDNAGPYSIGLDSDLPNTEVRELRLSDLSFNGKRGWLRKVYGNRGGLDYAFVTNSGPNDVKVAVSGGSGYTPVPAATSVNFDGPINSVKVKNDSGSNVPASDVDISVGNGQRENGDLKFSPAQVLSDLVPGVSR